MKKKLYYVVVNDSQMPNWKYITVYEIMNNTPKVFCNIECEILKSSKDEIQKWLDDNGYGDEDFEITML